MNTLNEPSASALSDAQTGETVCVNTDSHALGRKVSDAVSPAISLPVNPSTDENYTTESDGNKRSNQSGGQSTLKPNCYECKYRGGVPGSAHSSCRHPAFARVNEDPILQILGLLGKRGPLAGFALPQAESCKVVGDEHGIKRGWFCHPFNFDPVWLKSCTGFTEKQS